MFLNTPSVFILILLCTNNKWFVEQPWSMNHAWSNTGLDYSESLPRLEMGSASPNSCGTGWRAEKVRKTSARREGRKQAGWAVHSASYSTLQQWLLGVTGWDQVTTSHTLRWSLRWILLPCPSLGQYELTLTPKQHPGLKAKSLITVAWEREEDCLAYLACVS